MRFGRQRTPQDFVVLALLLVGFGGLAIAFYLLTASCLGLLLPAGYLLGAWTTLRSEVRELELRADVMFLRTFFRTYPIPRAHIRALRGTEIEVLNGNRYEIAPASADEEEVKSAVNAWFYESPPP